MSTKLESNVSAKAIEASIENMKAFGRAKGDSDNALGNACADFAQNFNSGLFGIANNDSAVLLDSKAKEYAGYYGQGQSERMKAGESVSEDSVKAYAAKLKLWAWPKVYARREEILSATDLIFATATPEWRKAKRHFNVASTLASKINKAKADKPVPTLVETVKDSEGKETKSPTPAGQEVIADITKVSTPDELSPAAKIQAAKDSFAANVILLQELNVIDSDNLERLRMVAATLGVIIVPPPKQEVKPENDTVSIPTPAPAPAPDMAALIAAAVAQAMASLAK
jgi:hypothetical protein